MKEVLDSAGQKLPDNLKNASELDKPIATGYCAFGAYRNVLTEVLAPMGYKWSIHNGQVLILKDEETGTNLYHIGREYAMIGSPEFGAPKRNGKPSNITVRSILYPQLHVGHKVIVESRDIPSGSFKLDRVRHLGDTHGDDWKSEVEIKPLELKPKPPAKRRST